MNRFQREKRESHLHVKSVQYQTLIDQMCCNRLRGMLIVGFSYAKSAIIHLTHAAHDAYIYHNPIVYSLLLSCGLPKPPPSSPLLAVYRDNDIVGEAFCPSSPLLSCNDVNVIFEPHLKQNLSPRLSSRRADPLCWEESKFAEIFFF